MTLDAVYFVANQTILWASLLFLGGVLFISFSRALGRIVAKGLE